MPFVLFVGPAVVQVVQGPVCRLLPEGRVPSRQPRGVAGHAMVGRRGVEGSVDRLAHRALDRLGHGPGEGVAELLAQ